MNYMPLVELIIVILTFAILFTIGKYIRKKIENSNSRFLKPTEYLPEDEIQTLKQVYYLIMMLLFFIFLLYNSIFYINSDFTSVAVLEIIVLAYIATTLDYSSWKNKILLILLIPYGSISFIAFENSIINFLDVFHIFAYAYLIKIYYGKFKKYTETNGLGITIILLFSIILLSFINTILVENVDPLNAIVMVSNAFTSNGYAVLGKSSFGKLNSIFLVWGGYILSGAGTATLTAAILTRHFNKRFDELKKLIEEKE